MMTVPASAIAANALRTTILYYATGSLVLLFLVVAQAETLSPVFDGHIHYSADARNTYSVDKIISILKQAGIERALVSSTPNDGTIALHEKDPARIVPELRPYRNRDDMGLWYRDPNIATFIETELKRGIYRSIGEFHLHAGQTDTPVVRRVVALAVERGIPLHAHSDDGAVRELFAIDPTVKIIWAHAGMSSPPATIRTLLDRHATLWVELSIRGGDIAPGGRLDSAWRELFLRYPDRFMIGTDTWITPRWEQVESENRFARAWLAQLPADVVEKIAFRNAAQLFPK
jgi:hypothetical protein